MIDVLIKIMADGLVVPIVLLGTYVLLFQLKTKHWFTSYVRILIAGLTAYILAKIIGHFFQPEFERPFEKLGVDAGAAYLDNPGFPSDHVLFCMAIFWAVWTQSKARWAAITILILTLMVGLGRILALVHTPLDVIGGIVIASIGALWYLTERNTKNIETVSRQKHKKHVE
jgi:membrane-associated phospholipid phosphatase